MTLTFLHALSLRTLPALAGVFAITLHALPVWLYLEGIWLQDLLGLGCFLIVSLALSAPLLSAGYGGWQRAGKLASG